MIVVSDTTPLNYLILIDSVHVLSALFGKVYAPTEVLKELSHPKSPKRVRQWAEFPPEWLAVMTPAQIDATLPKKLHRGEVEAISLARELRATQTLIDDWDARQTAKERNLHPIGTLNVLEEAACRDLIDIEQAVEALRKTSYWAIEEQYQTTVENVRVRKLAQEQDQTIQGPEQAAPQREATLDNELSKEHE